MEIKGLLVDHMESPWGIDRQSPLFSFLADGEGDFLAELFCERAREAEQTVQVGLFESIGFRFARPLQAGKRYRIRISCGEDACESEFLTDTDVCYPFITPAVETVCAPVFCRRFSSEKLREGRLFLTGLGVVRAYLNGERVGKDYLSPGCNDYHAYLRRRVYDVTALVREGENLLTVFVGNGWYRGRYGIDKPIERGDRVWGDRFLLSAGLLLRNENGAERVIATGEGWRVLESACRENSIYDGEVWEREGLTPWGLSEKRLAALLGSVEKEGISVQISEEPAEVISPVSPAIHAVRRLEPTLLRSPRGEQILDFGQNFAGVVEFCDRFTPGTRIRLLHGEVLQDGCFYRDNLRTARAEFSFVAHGEGHTVSAQFSYFGFRYVLVEGAERVEPADFVGLALSTDLRETLSFSSDCEALVRLCENAEWGQRSNFLDIPTDCPQRDERLGWTADARIFAPVACLGADAYSFYRKFLQDIRVEQVCYYGGDVPMYVPSLCGEADPGGAGWADAAVELPMLLYDNYGDRKLLSEHYGMMQDYGELLRRQLRGAGERGLLREGFTFGDWLARDGVTPSSLKGSTDDDLIRTVFAMHALEEIARAALILGREREAEAWAADANPLREALMEEFVTPRSRFAVDTQTGHLLALRHHLFRDRDQAVQGLSNRLRRDLYTLKCGFLGTPLLLSTLFAVGLDADAFRLLFATHAPGWMQALSLGATTFWERWDSLLPDGRIGGTQMNSLNHYAYGSVCEAIRGDIAGLRRESVGWGSAILCPHPDPRIGSVALSYLSPRGEYRVRWEVEESGDLLLEAEIPAGCRARVLLPDGSRSFDVGSGKKLFHCRPARELIHPYGRDSLLLDLFSDPAAEEVLKTYLPMSWEMLSGDRQFWGMPLSFLGTLPMFACSEEQLLKTVQELSQLRPSRIKLPPSRHDSEKDSVGVKGREAR